MTAQTIRSTPRLSELCGSSSACHPWRRSLAQLAPWLRSKPNRVENQCLFQPDSLGISYNLANIRKRDSFNRGERQPTVGALDINTVRFNQIGRVFQNHKAKASLFAIGWIGIL